MHIEYDILSIKSENKTEFYNKNLTLILILSGTGYISDENDTIFDLEPPDTVRLSPEEKYIYHATDHTILAFMEISDYHSSQNEFSMFRGPDNEYIKKTLLFALDIQSLSSPYKQEIMNSLYSLLWNMIIGIGIKSTQLNPSIDKVIDSIRKHHTNCEFDLSKEIEKSGYTPGHFRHLFKEQVGISPLNFLTNMRIDTAKKYMKDSTQKVHIKDIAAYCGFTDANFFSKQFKKLEGISPQKYLDIHKNQGD